MKHVLSIAIAGLIGISVAVCGWAEIKVYPRLITPGTPPYNEKVYFDFADFDDPKPILSIYDISGRKVREIAVLNPSVNGMLWQISWNGTDDSGTTVHPGVYVYAWETRQKTITGTIVVAR